MSFAITEEKQPIIGSTVETTSHDSSIPEKTVKANQADSVLVFLESVEVKYQDADFTPEEEKRLNLKLYWYLLPMIIGINTLLFIDKSTLSYASILGVYESTGIDDDQYDDLNSIFYAGYVVGQVLNFVAQKYNLARFLTAIIFSWSIIIFCHCGAYNFGGLIILRFILGFLESIVIPTLEITMIQFFTPKQRATIQPIFWVGCIGFPVVIAGFAAYGVLHVTHSIPPWKIFMIINGGLTFIASIFLYIWYPADPSSARFLSEKERYFLIKKIQTEGKASITQHEIKRYQVVECLKDPISWLFTLFCFLLMLQNNITFQENLLFVSLGVSNLGSTLVNVAGGGFASAWMLGGAILIHYFPDSTFYMGLLGCLPSMAAGIAMVTLKWSNKLGLLAALLLTANTTALSYITAFGWATSSCSGNTKRYFRNLMFSFAYGVSNIVSPQLWTGNQTERYYPAWAIQIVLSYLASPIVLGIITIILSKRNKERRQYIADNPDKLYGEVTRYDEATGKEVTERVNIANLDLTDLENKAFIYPL